MLIYCAHKYGGDEKNKSRVETLLKNIQKNIPEHTFISPIHAFGFMYHYLSYDEGMDLCLSLLSKCDALLVLSEESEGVRREIDFAIKNRKHIYFAKEAIVDGRVGENDAK